MAGTVTYIFPEVLHDVRRVAMNWTSDPSGDANGFLTPHISGEIVSVVFSPGAGGVQPTDLYDVTLFDDDGFDVLAGKGANRSNASKQQVVPLTGDGTTTNQRVAVDGALELRVAAAGNAKQGKVTVLYR